MSFFFPRIEELKRRLKTAYQLRLVGFAARRSGNLARLLISWVPSISIRAKSTPVSVNVRGEIGDLLMALGAIREAKKLDPSLKIKLLTKYPELVAGLEFIDQISGEEPGLNTKFIRYFDRPQRHAIEMAGDWLGIEVKNIRPACALSPTLAQKWNQEFKSFTLPVVVLHRTSSGHTPNKQWGEHNWNALIDKLLKIATIVEIGKAGDFIESQRNSGYVDLRGKTKLDDLAAIIANAQLIISPDSGPAHMAAAFDRPCITLFGGYTHPHQVGYIDQKNFFSKVNCAPCWRLEPCPYGLKCWAEIKVETVFKAAKSILGSI